MGTISIEYIMHDPLIWCPCWIWMSLVLREGLEGLISIKVSLWSSWGDGTRLSHSMCLLSSLKETVFERWMDSSDLPIFFNLWADSSNFLTSNARNKGSKVLFIGKLPPPPWKSRWAFTWVLGLSIRPHPGLLWLKSHLLWLWLWLWLGSLSGFGLGIDLEVASSLDRMLTGKLFDVWLGSWFRP